jgi:hypothetical protein
MKRSPLTTVLLVLVTISALASLVLCWMYISNTRELRNLQTQATGVNNNRSIIQALANDCVEYSKKNPAINPILEQAGVKPPSGSSPAPASNTRPGTK